MQTTEAVPSLSVMWMPDRIFPDEDGGFTWIFWNEQHDDGEPHDGIAGCFETHEVYAENVVQCFEECGAEDFFENITGYLHAFTQSSWCDAGHGVIFNETLRAYMFEEGYTLDSSLDEKALATMLYNNAVEHERGVAEKTMPDLDAQMAEGRNNAEAVVPSALPRQTDEPTL